MGYPLPLISCHNHIQFYWDLNLLIVGRIYTLLICLLSQILCPSNQFESLGVQFEYTRIFHGVVPPS